MPLNMLSGIKLDLEPEKKAHMEAYKTLINIGLRPGPGTVEADRQQMEKESKDAEARHVGSAEISAWLAEGAQPLAELTSGKTFSTTQAWIQNGKELLASQKLTSPGTEVWADT